MKLNKANLTQLAPEVQVPTYALADTRQASRTLASAVSTVRTRRFTPMP